MEKYYLGVDIGGMSVKAGVVGAEGKIAVKDSCVTRIDGGTEAFIGDVHNLCVKVAAAKGLKLSDLSGIGMGIPGTVDSRRGIVTYSGNLDFKRTNVFREWQKFSEVTIKIGNDANCAALGETRFGGGGGVRNSVLVTLGTGVGTGFIVDNKIFEGKNGEGAEGGHICVKMNGEKCTCGERGCWEAYASAAALVKQTARAIKKHPESLMREIYAERGELSARIAFDAFKKGDKTAENVVKRYVRYVATGITTMVNIFRPDVVIIGGGVSHEGEYFIKMVERLVRRHAFGGRFNKVPPVVGATLGNDAGIIGSAAMTM